VEIETGLPTCYRHPDRETRLSCSSCGRPTCVDCVRSAAVGQKCVDCAAPQGRSKVIRARDIRQTTGAPVTTAILAICIGVFVLGLLGGRNVSRMLVLFGAQINEAVAEGEWWRLFTSAFLHGNVMHILFNMWALYAFGPDLERREGSAAFAALYLSSAVAGGAAYYFLASGQGLAVGASGAIFGLFGAWLAAAFRSRHTSAGRASLNQLLILLGINAALPLLVPSIAWQAHLGGLVAGFLVGLAWGTVGESRTREPARTVAAAAVGLVALAFVML
jgi:membrane associated rhomboid family serine protease